MRIVLRVRQAPAWLRRIQLEGPANADISRTELFRQLINAALATPYYSQRERADALLLAKGLDCLPATPLRDYLEQSGRFINPKVRSLKTRFAPPLPTGGAVVAGVALEVPRNSRFIGGDLVNRLHMSDTRMLAATPTLLRRICAGIEAQTLALPALDEAVVAFVRAGEGALLPGERDMLWRCLGVPVFEQWLGLDGEVLAAECEAHQGLHWFESAGELEDIAGQLIVTSYKARRNPTLRLETGFSADVTAARCLCGKSGRRLLNLRSAALPAESEQGYTLSAGATS